MTDHSTDPYWRLHRTLQDRLGTSPNLFTAAELQGLLREAGLQVLFREADRGDGRKAHYGDKKQPVDTMKEYRRFSDFCFGNVLKYLRRSKSLEHSTESARVYFRWLVDVAKDPNDPEQANAMGGVHDLIKELNGEELIRANAFNALTGFDLKILPTDGDKN